MFFQTALAQALAEDAQPGGRVVIRNCFQIDGNGKVVGIAIASLLGIRQAVFFVDREAGLLHLLERPERDGVVDLAVEMDDAAAATGEELGEGLLFPGTCFGG